MVMTTFSMRRIRTCDPHSYLNFSSLRFCLGSLRFFLCRLGPPRLRGCFAGYVNYRLVVDSLVNLLGESLIRGRVADTYATVRPRPPAHWLAVMNADTPPIDDLVPA